MDKERPPALNASDLPFRVHSFLAENNPQPDEKGFNHLALELFAFQFQEVLIYRRFCENRGVKPGMVRHWSQIPALPIAAYKEHIVSSIPENERNSVFHSSGTTGQTPSRHFHGAESLPVYEASLIHGFERHFLADSPALKTESAAFIFLTPPPSLAPHSSLVHMFETIRKKFARLDSLYGGQVQGDGSWELDFEQIDPGLREAISSSRPVGLLGTAFSFVHWLDHLAVNKTRLRLPPGSRILETGGYKGRSRVVTKTDLRRLMTKYLGVPDSGIITEYGMTELSSQAYAGASGIFRFPPWARAQIISAETGAVANPGETGLLRVFDLANIGSVTALQTEDLALSREQGFELLGRVEASGPRGCSLMTAT